MQQKPVCADNEMPYLISDDSGSDTDWEPGLPVSPASPAVPPRGGQRRARGRGRGLLPPPRAPIPRYELIRALLPTVPFARQHMPLSMRAYQQQLAIRFRAPAIIRFPYQHECSCTHCDADRRHVDLDLQENLPDDMLDDENWG